MASPQLLWLPSLPNEGSPLLISKIRGIQAPPPLPPINSLSPAAGGSGRPPAGLNFLNSLPPYEGFNALQNSSSSLKATKTTITPIWSAKSGQDGPFKAIFGGNLQPPGPSKTNSAPRPSQLPLPLHRQSSFNFPPITAPAKQPVCYRDDEFANQSADNKKKDNSSRGDGSKTTSGDRDGFGDAGGPPISARPPHRRRKKDSVDPDADVTYNGLSTTTTSDEGSHGQLPQARERKKVRWAGVEKTKSK